MWHLIVAVLVHWLYHQSFPEDLGAWQSLVPKFFEASHIRRITLPEKILRLCIDACDLVKRLDAAGFHRDLSTVVMRIATTPQIDPWSADSLLAHAAHKLPLHSVVLQCLIDWYVDLWIKAGPKSADLYGIYGVGRAMLRRVVKRFRKLCCMTEEEKQKKRCYIEHESQMEGERCDALHSRYDEADVCAYFEASYSRNDGPRRARKRKSAAQDTPEQ